MSSNAVLSNLILEGYVAGFCMTKPSLMQAAVDEGVTGQTFCDPTYRLIFLECLNLYEASEPFNAHLLATRLPEHAGVIAELSRVQGEINFFRYIDQLKKFERLREFQHGIDGLRAQSTAADADLNALLNGLDELSTRLALQNAQGRDPNVKELVEGWKAERQGGALPAPIQLFPAGTEAARRITLRHGQILTIAGQTGCGKTALAAGMAFEALKAGSGICFCCMESSAGEIVTRIAAASCGIPHFVPDSDRCPAAMRARFNEAMDDLGNCWGNLHVLGNDGRRGPITPSRINALIKHCKMMCGKCDLLVVDFVQILSPPPGFERRTELERINATLDALHNTVTQHNVACVALSQCNRLGLTSGSEPSLDWLKNTSKLGELSHAVAFLVRNESTDVPGENRHRLLSKKTRGMPRFDIELTWDGATYKSQPEFPLP